MATALAMATIGMATSAEAKVRLPKVISDGMVVQQNADVRLWGWAEAGKSVKVTTSWDVKQQAKAKADKTGYWEVRVKTPAASFDPMSITFDDGEALTIGNVLAGEVWVCAGQSNMEMPVKGFGNCPVEDYNNAVIDAMAGIRSIKIPATMAETPQDDATGWAAWRESTPQNVAEFSATAYFFAQTLRRAMPDIPIGLIEANKGGTRVESWLSEENLKKFTNEDLNIENIKKKFEWDYHYPLLWGNGTFAPISRSTVAGIIYYQGCSNVGDPAGQYAERLKILVDQWRKGFQNENLPFYFVEIAPYGYGGADGTSGAELREQQHQAADIIPNSAIVCTNDLAYPYELGQIHPCQKKKVGQRLAFLALNRTYGQKHVICDSPTYKEMTIVGDTAYVAFDHLEGGYSRFDDIDGFEIAGADGVFHPAKAGHFWVPGNDKRNETVWVSSPDVKAPVAVRYCFRDFKVGNLGNQAGLPLVPFRTDAKK